MECIDCNINPPAKGRRICNNCKNKRYEAKYPIKVAYHRLKGHAKERGKEFSISLEYFTAFCIEVDYIARRGIYKKCIHIDRKEEELGYIEGNLQALEIGENVKKYRRWKQLNDQGKSEFHVVTVVENKNSEIDTPF